MKLLIKLGGTLLDTSESRCRLACEIAAAARIHRIVVVHGGGKQMTRFLDERGVESRFIGGLRVTTPEVVDALVKILAGSVNTELVAALRAANAEPVGLTGLDAGLVDAERLGEEYGAVGRPKLGSNAKLLDLLTREAYIPVVACVGGDGAGHIFNVNADQMAAACSSAFGAEKLLFLTDVDGVKEAGGETLAEVTAAQAASLIRDGIVTGGMQAKLEAAVKALETGVNEVLIAPGAQPGVVQTLLQGGNLGTRLCL